MTIDWLKDKNTGQKFYPITHEDAVIDNNGINLSTKLNLKLETLISGLNIKTVNNTSLLGNGNIDVGTYSKPSGGIPASDLSQAVQTSLGKADAALQEESVFVAEYGVTILAEILFALESGKIPVLYYDGRMYWYSTYTSTSGDAYFFNVDNMPNVRIARIDSSGWKPIQITRIETTGNRTADISANKTSTTKYPSTKGVADYVDTELGNYEPTSNKVTSISSSSTDLLYPSAKCIYDNYYNKNEIDSTLGNILFILDEIIGEYESSSEA